MLEFGIFLFGVWVSLFVVDEGTFDRFEATSFIGSIVSSRWLLGMILLFLVMLLMGLLFVKLSGCCVGL